jgi:hypothetical protein
MNRIALSAALVGAACLSAAGPAGRTLSADEFRQVRDLVRPCAEEEKWAQVPWLTSLWEARKQAAEGGKPILLWEMDGHPLGCT